jgi:protein-disulfide isomerase
MGKDEISQRFANLQEELKVLRSDVSQLRQTIADMQRSAVASPRAATPSPPTTSLRLDDDDPRLGNRQAPIGIVEFSDYQCASCLRFYTQILPRLKEAYIDTGRVQYIWRDFPLDSHAEAKGAAVAANCAGKQGVYWEMHQELFTNQHRLGTNLYEELPTTLKLHLRIFPFFRPACTNLHRRRRLTRM